MKDHDDLARGWWRKGDSDLDNARMCVDAGRALDTACFHAQQAAEKYLKAYLSLKQVNFPYLHNLAALVEICKGEDDTFGEMRDAAETLTPYAVEARYDDDFWPDLETTLKATRLAGEIGAFILARMPVAFRESLGKTAEAAQLSFVALRAKEASTSYKTKSARNPVATKGPKRSKPAKSRTTH